MNNNFEESKYHYYNKEYNNDNNNIINNLQLLQKRSYLEVKLIKFIKTVLILAILSLILRHVFGEIKNPYVCSFDRLTNNDTAWTSLFFPRVKS